MVSLEKGLVNEKVINENISSQRAGMKVFEDVYFDECELFNIIFDWSVFERTTFVCSSIKNTSFLNSKFCCNNFEQITFKNVYLAFIYLKASKFVNSQIEKSSFRSAFMPDTLFKNCVITETEFIEANLKKARFVNVRFEKVDFSGAILCDATFENVEFIDCIGLKEKELS